MRKRHRGILVVLGVLLGLPLLFAGCTVVKTSAALARHRHAMEDLAEKFRARARARPCAFGDALPGDSASLTRQALAMIADLTDEESDLLPGTDPISDLHAEAAAAVLDTYSPAVEMFREALRRPPSGSRIFERRNREPERDKVEAFFPGLMFHRARVGRSAEAFDALFLYLGILQDYVWETGTWSDLRRVEEETITYAAKILENHTLTVAQLDRLLETLDRLERSRPTLQDELDLEDLRLRTIVMDPDEDERMAGPYRLDPYRPIQPSWKNFGYRALARAQSLQEVEEHFRRRREIAALPWPKRWPTVASYLQTLVGKFVDPPSGHGLQIERAECYETYAAVGRTLLRVALEVTREDVLRGRFPDAPPGAPRSPRTDLPITIRDGALVDPGIGGQDHEIPIWRRLEPDK